MFPLISVTIQNIIMLHHQALIETAENVKQTIKRNGLLLKLSEFFKKFLEIT